MVVVVLLQLQNDRPVLEDMRNRQVRQEHMQDKQVQQEYTANMMEAVHNWEQVDYTQSMELIAHLADTKTTNYLDIAQEDNSWEVHSLERMRPVFLERSLRVAENKRLQLVRCFHLVI